MTEAEHARKARGDGDRTPGRTVRPAASKSHKCHSPLQCSRNRCLAGWTVPIPHRGRGGAAGRANSNKDLVTGPDPRFLCPTGPGPGDGAPPLSGVGNPLAAEGIGRPKAVRRITDSLVRIVGRGGLEPPTDGL
jgi:hypothetical protein